MHSQFLPFRLLILSVAGRSWALFVRRRSAAILFRMNPYSWRKRMHITKVLPDLLCYCHSGRKQYPVHAEKDNCCYWKTASVSTFVHEEDLVYASYDNADFCCPFFVALDHSTKTIVIVIRGSFSFVDFLVDFSVTPTPMGIQGLPAEFKVFPHL